MVVIHFQNCTNRNDGKKREFYEASSPLRTTQAFYDSVESITGNIRINSNRQEQGINIK